MAQQIAGKAARDGLFLVHYGPQALPAMIAGAAGFSVMLSLLNGRLMNWLAPRAVLPWALGLSGVLQLGEWALLRVNPSSASIVIYLHMLGLGAVLLSTFWSMLNEEFDPREAKRRFGRIAAGGTVGGLLGGIVAERTVALSGAPALMLILAGLHLAGAAFLAVLMKQGADALPKTEPTTAPAAGTVLPRRSPLLVTLGTIVVLGALGAALLDYVFKVYATDRLGRGSDLVRFFAFFHTGVALLGFLLQSAGAKIFLEKFGLGKTIVTLPATLAGGSFLTLVFPGAVTACLARGVEAAVHSSLFRAGYETCYTPIAAAQKRLAKTFIDVGAERGGDALGAAVIFICIHLAGQSAIPWILSIAAIVGLCSLIFCRTLDGVYIKTLAKSLESRAVQLHIDADMDLTTKAAVISVEGMAAAGAEPGSGEDVPELFNRDPVLKRLSALRSSDLKQVNAALTDCDASDPLVATEVCLLLGRDEHAFLAHAALVPVAPRVLGLLTDLMLDTTVNSGTRRRLARIIGSVPGERAADALIRGLADPRFKVRLQCARSLSTIATCEPRPVIQAEKIIVAVDRELAIGRVLWESHRKQLQDPGEFATECLDELLRDKAHGSLEYVFTLLSLIHDRTPLMAAFRSLHLEDRHLRGTALEYLEGILPAKSREMLWEILQERPSQSAERTKVEIMQDLMSSSDTVVQHLRRNRTGDSTTTA
jgi:ATP/ADP translocase